VTEPASGYPHHLVGEPAPPPAAVSARTVGMAVKLHRKQREAAGPHPTASGWPNNPRPARSIVVLRDEANAADPNRATASDGMIGDAAHAAQARDSDHNGWLVVNGVGVVRAVDITNDPALNLPAVAERIRAAAAAGRCPQVLNGGYVILNGRITDEDWRGWHVYNGADPHVSHMHVSVSLNPAQFDLGAPWGVFSNEHPAPAPQPAPAPPAPRPGYNWTGPDLSGAGSGLRGDKGNNGPRVGALHDFLRVNYPLYAGGMPDASSNEYGWYGDKTAAALAEFAHRSGIPEADGLNIGPKIAAALHAAGFDRTAAAPRSAARARVLGHIHRRGSR
jgi:hypothetical protein